jgi:hypothetical protein
MLKDVTICLLWLLKQIIFICIFAFFMHGYRANVVLKNEQWKQISNDDNNIEPYHVPN